MEIEMNMTSKQLMQLARRFNAVVRRTVTGAFIVYAGAAAPYWTSSTADAADHIRTIFYQSQGAIF